MQPLCPGIHPISQHSALSAGSSDGLGPEGGAAVAAALLSLTALRTFIARCPAPGPPPAARSPRVNTASHAQP
jgi:hypothetical protein